MPELQNAAGPTEQMYCSQQINIPPELPDLLKQFTKATIRTQPKDVLSWSAAYFKALSSGQTLPVKERLEMISTNDKNTSPLSVGLIGILNRQMGCDGIVDYSELQIKWLDMSLPLEQLQDIKRLGNFGDVVEWLKFLALCCTAITSEVAGALKVACEILTTDLEGGAARIPFETFSDMYRYLAQIDGEISPSHVQECLDFLSTNVDKQEGMIMPRNFYGDFIKLDERIE